MTPETPSAIPNGLPMHRQPVLDDHLGAGLLGGDLGGERPRGQVVALADAGRQNQDPAHGDTNGATGRHSSVRGRAGAPVWRPGPRFRAAPASSGTNRAALTVPTPDARS